MGITVFWDGCGRWKQLINLTWSSTVPKNTYAYNTYKLHIPQNTPNSYNYNICNMWYCLCLKVLLWLLFSFGILLCCSCSNAVYNPIMMNVPTLFLFRRLNLLEKSMQISFWILKSIQKFNNRGMEKKIRSSWSLKSFLTPQKKEFQIRKKFYRKN